MYCDWGIIPCDSDGIYQAIDMENSEHAEFAIMAKNSG
jgi:hypothetical protein